MTAFAPAQGADRETKGDDHLRHGNASLDIARSGERPLPQMQQALGNTGMRSLLERHRVEQPHRIAATIARAQRAPAAYRSTDRDDPSAPAADPNAPTRTPAQPARAQTNPQQPNPAEPAAGTTVTLPDIDTSDLPHSIDEDAIASTLAYASSVTQGGTPPANLFGATDSSWTGVTGVTVTQASGSFQVSATVNNTINISVWTTAPGGRTDILSETDPAITATNYRSVVHDLTPNATTNIPPRRNFWASDLTLIHEQFHAGEAQTMGAAGTVTAQGWLNTQTAGSTGDVHTLLRQVPQKAREKALALKAAPPGPEPRAYAGTASGYTTRSSAIKTKGDAGGYAPPAPPPGSPAPGQPAPAPGQPAPAPTQPPAHPPPAQPAPAHP